MVGSLGLLVMWTACLHSATTLPSGTGIFDPCYFWPGAVYAGDGMCFLLVEKPEHFDASKKVCGNGGASLAELRTQHQRDTVSTLIGGGGSAFLGGLFSGVHGQFLWLSDQQEVSVPIDWWSNSLVPQPSGDDLCLTMSVTSELSAHNCLDPLRFVCQIYAGNPCDSFLPGAEYYDSHCFLPVTQMLSLPDAGRKCRSREAYVAEASSEALTTYLKYFADLYLDPNIESWLGLTKNSTYEFKWSHSGDMVSSANWATGEPGISGITDDSGVVMDGTESWEWRVVSKTTLAQVICQRDISAECDGVFSQARCFTFQGLAASWSVARDDCLAKGAYLPEPMTAVLDRTVLEYVKNNSNAKFYYLGGSDLQTEGTFIWENSRQPLKDTYRNWAKGEPNNVDKIEHVLGAFTSSGRWNDFKTSGKSREAAYVCERAVIYYAHSYLLVLPKEDMGGHVTYLNASVSMISHPDEAGTNSVKISTFPTGYTETTKVSSTQGLQYEIDHKGLLLDSSGLQHKYVLIRSEAPLDIHLFIYGQSYACSSLVFEVLPPGQSSSFFINPGLMMNSFGIVTTDEISTRLTFSGSTSDESLSFSFNGLDLHSRDMLTVSTELPDQYQSQYVDTMTGSEAAASAHSTGALGVFSFGQETRDVSLDLTCDQTLPTSLVGSDYVTFPSLPTNPGVSDYFTVVAIYNFTEITVYDSGGIAKISGVMLLWAGDTVDLELPASGFHHVTGNSQFYLYAKLSGAEKDNNGRKGLCSLALFPDSLFREAYTVAAVGPLLNSASVYVVVIVRREDKADMMVESVDTAVISHTDYCENLSGTNWTGCYFDLTSNFTTDGSVFRVKMDSSSPSQFGAYLLARPKDNPVNLMCSALGVPALLPDGLDYNFTDYLTVLQTKPLCEESASTTAATTTASDDENINTAIISTTNNNSTINNITMTTIKTTTTTNNTNDTSMPTTNISTIFDTKPAELPECLPGVISNATITKLLTTSEMEKAVEEIVTHLSVKKVDLSSVRRTKESAPDHRASSTGMGYMSLSFFLVFISLVILSDCRKLFMDVTLALRNIISFST